MLSFRRNSLALVAYFKLHGFFRAREVNLRGRAARVTVNVGKAFLHDAKDNQFQFVWKSAQVAGQVEIDLNLASLGEPAHIPSQCGC